MTDHKILDGYMVLVDCIHDDLADLLQIEKCLERELLKLNQRKIAYLNHRMIERLNKIIDVICTKYNEK